MLRIFNRNLLTTSRIAPTAFGQVAEPVAGSDVETRAEKPRR